MKNGRTHRLVRSAIPRIASTRRTSSPTLGTYWDRSSRSGCGRTPVTAGCLASSSTGLTGVAPPSDLAYFIDYNPNPNAANPAAEILMRALTGETEFHLMWQRRRQPEAGPLLPQSG